MPSPKVAFAVLYSVAANSANDTWAVGEQGGNGSQTLIEHWNGTDWKVVSSPNLGMGDILTGVSTLSTNNAWAVGYDIVKQGPVYQTLIEHWNGTSWSVVSSPNPGTADTLSGVSAISTNNVWAVGTSVVSGSAEALIEHWDGTQWSLVSNPGSGASLNAVTAIAANNIWAAGEYPHPGGDVPLIEHWNGTQWSIIASPNPGPTNLNGITSVPGTKELWAVGVTGGGSTQTLIEHWNGASWRVVPSPNERYFNSLAGVAASSTSNVWTVGRYFPHGAHQMSNGEYEVLIEHWTSSQWELVSGKGTRQSSALSGIANVPGTSQFWAVGELGAHPLVEHTC